MAKKTTRGANEGRKRGGGERKRGGRLFYASILVPVSESQEQNVKQGDGDTVVPRLTQEAGSAHV